MAAKYDNGLAALNSLLDAAESSPNRVRMPFAAINHAAMSAATLDEAYRLFDAAAGAGAIVVRYEKAGFGRRRPVKIALADADNLARFLGRPRAAATATEAVSRVRAELPDLPSVLSLSLEPMEQAWARSKTWRRIDPNDIAGAIQTFRIAAAILARNPADLIDERTFSARTVNDSKALRRRRDTVLAILIESGAVKPDATLESFGITAFPEHVQLRGPVALALPAHKLPLDLFDPSAAIPPEQVHLAELIRQPIYLLTIENKTSFQRYVRQIRDDSLIVFTSGFVSEPCASLLKRMVSAEIPWFHWGDIDAGGLSIFHWLETNVAHDRRITPHLMSRALAQEHGTTPLGSDPRLARIAQSRSAVADLAQWLAGDPEARILEQEVLDPVAPALSMSACGMPPL